MLGGGRPGGADRAERRRRWCGRPRSSAGRCSRGRRRRRARSWPTSSTHRLHALFAVGVALGLRKGELLALRGTMSTWTAACSTSGTTCSGCRRVSSSGRQSRTSLVAPFRCRRCRYGCCAPSRTAGGRELALGPAWIDSGLVFTSTVGTVIEPRNLSRLFDELIAKAGVRRIRFHDLRHTCASLLLAQNVPPEW